jgi:RsiW-degrading membrane proteinase PrsW (M82 family)/ribosomal protein S18 acetylase RimI-like enzyme
MLLLSLAIAPGLAICIYIFYRDNHDKEPALNLLLSFFWGMLTIIPALVLELAADGLTDLSITGIIINAFVFVALIEEFSKYLALRLYAFRRRSFDEPLDGIIYSVMVAMGFATVENVFYAIEFGMSTAMLRMFTAVPAHATFGILMGYYVGKAKFDFVKRKTLLIKGVLAATIAHGFYDAFLFMNENTWIQQYISKDMAGLLLFAAAMVSLIIAIAFSRRLIRLHRLTSKQLYTSVPVLTIRHASKSDVELIRTLSLQIWPKTYGQILSQHQIKYMMQKMYSEHALKQQMEEGHQFIIVYNLGVPIGFASYGEIEPSIYKLHKLYLLPRQQGRGSGKFVIEQVIIDIKPKGAVALRLNVNRDNQAKGFYEKLGFHVIRTEDIDIGNGYFMNDFVMERILSNDSLPVEDKI